MTPPDTIPEIWTKPIAGFDPWANAPEGSWFDVPAAESCCEFFPERLKLKEGEFAGEPFELEPWQKTITGYAFGWKLESGVRRFDEIFVYIPRKNGKTTWAAGLILLLFTSDGEPAAQVYCAAADTDQAAIVFNESHSMVQQDPEMNEVITVRESYRSMKFGNNILRVLSSTPKSKHGLNLSAYVVDEVHAQKNGDLIEAMETGTASRRQPLGIFLTTADHIGDTVCNEKLDYALKVRDGTLDDPSLLPVIYCADKDDDWRDLETWKKANPNYGVSLKPAYARKKINKAISAPSFLPTLKRLHLNIQTNKKESWLDMMSWNECPPRIPDSELTGLPCHAGIDLGCTNDLTSLSLYFPAVDALKVWFWAPEDAIAKHKQYQKWVAEGWIESTPGNVTDYNYVEAAIVQAGKDFRIIDIGADPYNATQTSTNLAETHGFSVFDFRQGYKSMNEPSKEFERLVMKRTLAHGHNPVLSWMASNVMITHDPAQNIKPVKSKPSSPLKIDGIVASIMAIGRHLSNEHEQPSMASRGIVVTL